MESNIPKENMQDPNTKGDLNTVKFDLFEFDTSGQKPPKRFSLDMGYDPNNREMHLPSDGLKVTITVGDNCASSGITLPMWFLSMAIGNLMAQYGEFKQKSLVGFDKPGIVGLDGKKIN